VLKEELEEDADDFFGEVIISGAQLTLKDGGRLANAKRFLVQNGGTLFLDNSAVAHDDRLGETAAVDLYAGTLAFDPGDFGAFTQELGRLTLLGGANQIDLYLGSAAGGLLRAKELWRENNAWLENKWFLTPEPTATLNINYIGSADSTNVLFEPNKDLFTWGHGILPWATITRDSQVHWVKWEDGASTVFNPLTTYHTGSPAGWEAEHNVLIDGGTAKLIYNDPGYGDTEINSLKLANGASLVLETGGDWQNLLLFSGGLLSTGSTGNQISGVGSILGLDTLYLHIHGGDLLVSGSIDFWSGAPIVKTGEGTLRLNGNNVRMLGNSLVINQGTVAFEQGDRMIFRTVIVGDGTGTDVLELPANHTDPITSYDGTDRYPLHIILHGTTHSTTPDSGEVDAAILRFGGGTIQHAQLLHVEGRGTLDFKGGTDDDPNMFYLEAFTLADFTTTLLFIRHWEDKSDVLLVRYEGNETKINEQFLARIRFEGYDPDEGGATAQWVYWGFDEEGTEYWEIRPFPEPATYGAILGLLGLGLSVWRRWKRGERAQHT